jgi:hypothetical protein
VGSGVSEVSERDKAHLRQISDVTVSSIGTQGGDRVLPEVAEEDTGAPLGSPNSPGQSRRSIFRESKEDMGGGGGS